MRVTAWLNQKGGVGKSGGAVGTAGALVERGRRVWIIDLDPQGHLTTEALQLESSMQDRDGAPTLANALVSSYRGSIADLLVDHTSHPSGGQLQVIPTGIDMFVVARALYIHVKAKEDRLRRLLEDAAKELPDDQAPDHVIIDCPPALDVLTDNALAAAHGLLIPVEPDKTSMRALVLLLEQINAVQEDLRLAPRDLHGLVPSVYRRPLSGLDRHVMGQLEAMDEHGLPIVAHLPLATRVKEAWLAGTPITLHDPDAPISGQYRRLAVLLDIAAGLAEQAEWDQLPVLDRQSETTRTGATS